MLMPATTAAPKRIVFHHHTGLALICGILTELPVTLPPFEILGETIPFSSLYRVTNTAAYYRAPIVPKSYQPSDRPLFDKRQR